MSADLTLYLYEIQLKEPLNVKEQNGTVNISSHSGACIEKVLHDALEQSTNVKWEKILPMRKMGPAGYMTSFVTNHGSNVIFRYYPSQNLLTVDLQGLRYEDKSVMDVANCYDKLTDLIFAAVPAQTDGDYIPIPRGAKRPADNLYVTDEQQVYIYDKELCEKESKFQEIKIVHTIPFGNALFLDGQINLAESDLCYTHGLMHQGEIDYKDKEVLILGGGDGALMHELLKEHPKFVTMVDIDDMVMTLCAKHMRSCCGDVLDGDRKGPHHQVIVGDCFEYLDKFVQEGRKFDFIFSDLTDCPIGEDEEGEDEEDFTEFWTLMEKGLDYSLKLLRPGGRFFTHLIGFGDCRPAQAKLMPQYEEMLKNKKMSFERTMNFVPSFGDKWVYYMATPKA